MALLKYLIPVFFVVMSLGELARISFIPAASVGLVDAFVLAIITVWLFKVKKSEYLLKNAIFVFVAVAIFSLLLNFTKYTNKELFVSSLYIIRFVLYSGLYFVFRDIGPSFKSKIPKYMFLTGFLFIVIGFLQYYIVPGLKKYSYLGWDMHQDRIFSTFLDPNFTGVFLVLILVFTLFLKDKIFSKKYQWVFYVFVVVNFLAIILTYSRGAYLMLLVCTVAYSCLSKSWKITLGLLFSFGLIFLILSPKFGLESTNLLRLASIEARIESNQLALNIWKENPMGVGFNAYRYAREDYGEIDNKFFGPSHAGAGVDNSFIFVLVTAGVLGLTSYIYFLFKILTLGFMNIKNNRYATVLFISIMGLIANAMFINSLFYSFILIWIFILAGLTESSERE